MTVALGVFAAGILSIAGVLILLWGGVLNWVRDRDTEKVCRSFIEKAQGFASRDDFDTSLRFLRGETDESKPLVERCKDNRDIDILRRKVSLFKIAFDIDQFRLVERDVRDAAIKEIRDGLSLLRVMTTDDAEFDALAGLLADLQDMPETAEGLYEAALQKKANYANAYNYWGHTTFRWRMGGGAWHTKAVEKFKRAADLKPDYEWAHANQAIVHLALADEELEKKSPRYDVIVAELARAKTSLDALWRLAGERKGGRGDGQMNLHPSQPRLIIPRAQYHLIQGQAYSLQEGREQDAYESFTQAKNLLLAALVVNANLVEAHLLLGLVHEELWLNGNDPQMKEQAVISFRKAVSLDGKHLEASRMLAYALIEYEGGTAESGAVDEVRRGLKLVEDYRADLEDRLLHSTEATAKDWLHGRRQEIDRWEQAFRHMGKVLKLKL